MATGAENARPFDLATEPPLKKQNTGVAGAPPSEMDIAKLLSGLHGNAATPAPLQQLHPANFAAAGPPGSYDAAVGGVPNAWQVIEYYQQYMSYMCQPHGIARVTRCCITTNGA